MIKRTLVGPGFSATSVLIGAAAFARTSSHGVFPQQNALCRRTRTQAGSGATASASAGA